MVGSAQRGERQTRERACLHVLRDIMDLDDDCPLEKSLKATGQASIVTIMSMQYEDINSLEYKLADNTMAEVPRHQLAVIYILQQFNRHHHNVLNDPITDWTTITRAEMDIFRTGPNYNPSPTTAGVEAGSGRPSGVGR